ncbi:hypothetical protein GCM10020227_42690 [Streptomyces flavovirens]
MNSTSGSTRTFGKSRWKWPAEAQCVVAGASVQVSGRREDVTARADGDQPRPRPDVREGGRQFVGEPALLVDRPEFVRGGHDDGVRGAQGLGAVLDDDVEVGVGQDGARRAGGAGDDLVQLLALAERVGDPREAEDPLRDAQFEGQQPVQGEDDDTVRHAGSCTPVDWAFAARGW